MSLRSLSICLILAVACQAAPAPFVPKAKKHTGPSPEDVARSLNGTYRVVSYEYGNAARIRGVAVARAVVWSEVVIKDGTWTQVRDIGGRKLSTSYSLKIDATKPFPVLTMTLNGNPDPTFVGVAQAQGGQTVVFLGTRGREIHMPPVDIGLGQYRWVLERVSN